MRTRHTARILPRNAAVLSADAREVGVQLVRKGDEAVALRVVLLLAVGHPGAGLVRAFGDGTGHGRRVCGMCTYMCSYVRHSCVLAIKKSQPSTRRERALTRSA